MSSDVVNSIADTPESLQVAQILQNKYYDIIARGQLTIDETLFQLYPSDNASSPVMMSLPPGVSRIDWLQYYDTNPLDNMQTDQFGSYSHDLNLDLVSSVSWITTSSSTITIPSLPTGTVTFTVASSTLPVTLNQLVQATASGTNSIIGNVLAYAGTSLTISVNQTTGIPGVYNNWVIESVAVPNVPPGYKSVTIVPLEYFLNIINRYDLTQPFVGSYTLTFPNVDNPQIGTNSFTFRYQSNHTPTMCTVIQNSIVLFDMFDNTQDSTLQASKTLAFGQRIPVFIMEDQFVPMIDDIQFPLLISEATSLAYYELKQQTHTKADEEIKRQWAVAQKTKSKSGKPTYFDQLSNFGRIPRTGGYGGYPPNLWMRNSLGNSGFGPS